MTETKTTPTLPFLLSDIDEVELESVDMSDYPDFCDAYISWACLANGKEVPQQLLDIINDYHSDFVYNKVIEQVF